MARNFTEMTSLCKSSISLSTDLEQSYSTKCNNVMKFLKHCVKDISVCFYSAYM